MAISPSQVKELRSKTGAGLMDCKRALEEHDGDIEAAQDALRKKGQIIADKKSGREANEGMISMLSDQSGKNWALVKINCETDFVANNDQFIGLANKLCGLLLAADTDENFATADTAEGNVKDILLEAITALGENIVLGGCKKYQATDDSVIGKYTHTNSKIGVIVDLKTQATGNAEVEQLAKDLSMQIAAFQVEAISEKDVPAEILEKERVFLTEQAKESGKPDDVIAKMVEGRLKKFRKDICLLDQSFVKDPSMSAKDRVDSIAKSIGSEIEVSHFIKLSV